MTSAAAASGRGVVGAVSKDGGVPDPTTAPLDRFSEPTRTWFGAAFAEPTPAQAGAWEAIGAGRHALVVAPTGSGKTLSAFLWSIDRLLTDAAARGQDAALPGPLHLPAQGARRRRRAQPARPADRHPAHRRPARRAGARGAGRRPLRRHPGRRPAQARHRAARHPDHHARVAVPDAHQPGPRVAARRRDGDRRRGARGRRHQARRPPRASPSSGSTRCSSGRPSGSGCRRRCARSRRWPGSSAAARRSRSWRRLAPSSGTCKVVVPVEDMTAPERVRRGRRRRRSAAQSIWPHVEERVVDLIEQHRSTIVFANSRRLAERLTARLNEIATERGAGERRAARRARRPQVMAQSGRSHGRRAR